MRGSSEEILIWLSYHHEYAPLMQMSRQRLTAMRSHINNGEVCEANREAILERLKNRLEALQSSTVHRNYGTLRNIRKVRDKYYLPAIVRDHHGKFYSEITMVKMVEHEEKMHDLNLDMVCRAIKRGDFPSERVVREVLRRKGWNMFEERMIIPSVWEVEY